jgi:hypothetical protein
MQNTRSRAQTADRDVTLGRLAVSRAEAAAMLGVSEDFFREHVAPEVMSVRRGRRRLYPVAGLQRWLEDASDEGVVA